MIDWTILAATLLADLFLALGYGLAKWEQFVHEGRLTVLALMEALRP